MNATHFIGWDVGGAHLKVASVNAQGCVEYVIQVATPLWKGLESLHEAFSHVLKKLPEGTKSHAVTMTGELVDIFIDRASGVNALVGLCKEYLGEDVRFYDTDSNLISFDDIKNKSSVISSANWHASVTYIASSVESGVFIDVGSTTTDIIPFSDKKNNARGIDDQSRLRFDELVYTGVIRTSLMSLANIIPFAGEWQNLTAEHFANTADIYRVLGYLGEDDDLMDTADENGKDVASSLRRIARMLGTDSHEYKDNDWYAVAQYFKETQLQLLTKSVLRILTTTKGRTKRIIGAGAGCFLVEALAQRLDIPYQAFNDLCTGELMWLEKCNTCAPAIALAQLNRLS